MESYTVEADPSVEFIDARTAPQTARGRGSELLRERPFVVSRPTFDRRMRPSGHQLLGTWPPRVWMTMLGHSAFSPVAVGRDDEAAYFLWGDVVWRVVPAEAFQLDREE